MKKVLKKQNSVCKEMVELYNIECTNGDGNGTCTMNVKPDSFISCTLVPTVKSWFKK